MSRSNVQQHCVRGICTRPGLLLLSCIAADHRPAVRNAASGSSFQPQVL